MAKITRRPALTLVPKDPATRVERPQSAERTDSFSLIAAYDIIKALEKHIRRAPDASPMLAARLFSALRQVRDRRKLLGIEAKEHLIKFRVLITLVGEPAQTPGALEDQLREAAHHWETWFATENTTGILNDLTS